MAAPKNPYFDPIYSPSSMTWGDQEAGTPVFGGKYNITPYNGDFNAWAREYTDPAYRAKFAYADPGYDGGAGMGAGTKSLNALPNLWPLAMSGYFDQFGPLTPEQQEWLGSAIAREQHIASGNNVAFGLGENDLALLSVLAGPAIGAFTAPAAGGTSAATAGAAEGAAVGGLNVGPGAAATMGTGGGAAIPAAGLNASATAPELLGAGYGATAAAPAAGLSVSPQAMAAFGAGVNLPYAASSGIMAGGEGLSFGSSAPSAGTGATSAPGGLRVGPEAGSQMGVSSTPGATSGASQAANAAAQTAQNTQQMTFVDSILKQMKDNALALGLMGTGLAIQAGQKPQLPNEEQIRGLSGEAQATAQQLLQQYRAGSLSASQQASLEQLTRQTKNQITQYFSSIGQADSTAHQQALAQVDQQGLVMKQQMLDNMLQNGLQALGIASGPLNTIANYQLQQDQSLRQAFGNFATSVGTLFGRQAGASAPQQVRPLTSAGTPVQSTQLPAADYQPPA